MQDQVEVGVGKTSCCWPRRQAEKRVGRKMVKTDFTSLLILPRATITTPILGHGAVSIHHSCFYLGVHLLSAYRAGGARDAPVP